MNASTTGTKDNCVDTNNITTKKNAVKEMMQVMDQIQYRLIKYHRTEVLLFQC